MSHVPPPPPGAGPPGPDEAKTQKLGAQPGWGQQGPQGAPGQSDQQQPGQPWQQGQPGQPTPPTQPWQQPDQHPGQQPGQQWQQPGGPQHAGQQAPQQQPWQQPQQAPQQQWGQPGPYAQQPGQQHPGQPGQWGQPGAPAQQGAPGPWGPPGQQPQQQWGPGQQGGYPGQPGQPGQQWGQQRPAKKSRGLLVGIVVAVVVVALAVVAYLVFFTGSTPEALEPDVSSSTEASVGQLVVGNCLEDMSDGGSVGDVSVVPCSDDHSAQVVGSTTFTDGDFPGQSTLVAQTTAICSPDLVTSGDVPADDLSLVVWTPSEDSWAGDDRTGLCIAVVEGGLSGSLLD